jgi:hypothetical protein
MAFQEGQNQPTQKVNYIGWYVVAFLDLLGQQAALRKVTALPNLENQEEADTFKRKVREFYEPLKALRKWFEDSIKSFMEGGIKTSGLTSEDQELLRKIRSTPIRYRHFSDCVVIHIPLRDDIGKIPCRAIFGVLAATAITFLSCMSHKWAIRGGIELGIAMDIEENEIYGPVLERAYTLESKVAQYPRIVVGEELIRYLKEIEGTISNPTFLIDDRVNAGAAAKSIELLAEDDDGQMIVDYLGVTIRTVFQDTKVIQNAYNFIIKECNRYKKLKNSKLGFRYSLLRNYFESRLPDWGLSIQSG